MGLNGDEIVKEYNAYVLDTEKEHTIEQEPTVVSVESKTFLLRKLLIAATALVIIVGLLGLFSGGFGSAGGNLSENNEPRDGVTYIDNNKNTISENDNSVTPAPASEVDNGVDITLDAEGRCWMRVTVDGDVAFEGFMISGEKKQFSAKENIRLRLGNAGVINVTYNGNNLGYLGEHVVVQTFESTN